MASSVASIPITTSKQPTLQLPFLGLLSTDSEPLTKWQNKILGPARGTRRRAGGGAMSPSASLRRFGAASLLAASVSSVSRRGDGVDGNASMSTSRAQSPTSAGPRTLNPFQRASPPKPASPTTNEETSKTVILLDDTLTMELFGVVDDGSLASPTHGSSVSPDGVVGGGAPLNSSRMHHMQAVQAKLDRSREAHVKAEEKRQAIHDAAKEATRGVRVLGVSDLESVDKRNYLHPDADKRADLAARVQKHKQRGFTTYLSRVPFSTGAV